MTFQELTEGSLWAQKGKRERIVKITHAPEKAGSFVFYRRVSYPFQRSYPECAITAPRFLQNFAKTQSSDAVDPVVSDSVDPTPRD